MEKANWLQDATIEQLESIVRYMREHILSGSQPDTSCADA